MGKLKPKGERSLDRSDHVSCILQIYINFSSALLVLCVKVVGKRIAYIALCGTSDPLLSSSHSCCAVVFSMEMLCVELKFSIVK